MIFKVDFEKAYDSVCWDYLDDVLKRYGFGDKWCGWIQSCLRSSRELILVNGSPTKEFQFYKGLKQGDPLSPFLFILVMKSLNLSFQRVVNAGIFKAVCMGLSLKLSHLFYADDVIFMGQWCESNISTIVQVLQCFYRASGLRINVHKSKLIGIGVLSNQVEQASSHICCLTFTPPFSYLVVKVGGMMSQISTWNEVVQRLLDRLSKWKMKMLSIGGRGKFFNGMDLNEKKMVWVSWSNVLASKQKGGLVDCRGKVLNLSSLMSCLRSYRVLPCLKLKIGGFGRWRAWVNSQWHRL
ncbi:RNA-directed DNA polymerase, eukaryota [Tanacetum coccineum]